MDIEIIMITWLSTKSPSAMLDTPISADLADFLRAHQGVDSKLLVAELGLCERHVHYFQRRLGLRKCVPGTKSLR